MVSVPACESCGRTASATAKIIALAVAHRRTREKATLHLCARCLSRDRAWRLTWKAEDE